MDLLNTIRELLSVEDPPNITSPELCKPLCDPTVNQLGFCISPCLNICPNVCRFPNLPLVPPPDPPKDFPRKSHHLSSHWITVLAIFATSVVVITFAIYMRYYSDWCRPRRRRLLSEQPQTSDNHEDFLDGPELDHPIWYIRTIGLEPSIIGAITVCKYKRGDGLVEGTECSVCLNEFHDDEVLRLLPKCNHAFHIPCIDTWLRAHTNCPICRAPIVTNIVQTAIEGSSSREVINVTTTNDVGSSSELEIIIDQASKEKEDEGETSVEGSSKRLELENPIEMQLLRRSVSMYAFSATRISVENADVVSGDSSERDNSAPEAAEDDQNQQLNGIVSKRMNEEKVILQSGSAPIGRSLSWSGRFFLSSYGSILPLRRP